MQNTQAVTVPLRVSITVSEIKVQEAQLKFRVLHSKPVTPVRVDRLEFLLQWYDEGLSQFLVNGFRYGFKVCFVGERLASESPNLKSALQQPEIVRTKLRKECDAGRIVGPFTTPPFLDFGTSLLGIVPKKDPSEFRSIHHLSYPNGSSVNDFILEVYSTLRYASVSDASKAITTLGRGFYGQSGC